MSSETVAIRAAHSCALVESAARTCQLHKRRAHERTGRVPRISPQECVWSQIVMGNHRTRRYSQEARVASTTVPPPAPQRKLAEDGGDAGQLTALLEAVADGVVVFDREGRVLHDNPVARELLSLDQRSMGVPHTIREVGR